MTTRLLQEAQPPYSETIKRKMRTLFRQGLGLARNASEATIANVIGVQPRLLYNYLAQDYNNYVRAENERILAQRRRQAQERRQQRAEQARQERSRVQEYYAEKQINFKEKQRYNFIDNQATKIKKKDMTEYNTKEGVFVQEVKVVYTCRQKADDWSEEEPKWKAPFQAFRSEIVIATNVNELRKKAQDKAEHLIKGLEQISPELNSDFKIEYGNLYNSNNRVPITQIKMRNSTTLKLNDEPLSTWDIGSGRCVYDALISLWKQPNSKMGKKANYEWLNNFFTDEENEDPENNGISIDELMNLARQEKFSMYAFNIHDKLIISHSNEETRQSKKPVLIFRIHNNHIYTVDDKKKQASLIAKNRKGEKIRHNQLENDKKKYAKEDTTTYKKVIPNEDDLTGNEYAVKYIFENKSIPFPMTNHNIRYDKGHIKQMNIGNNKIFTQPVERDIADYLEKNNLDYTGQHYINLLMEFWKEVYGKNLQDNELISEMNPYVCDMLSLENVKNRVHIGSMMQFENMEEMIQKGEIVGADIIKCYSSILDNPLDNWLQYSITDEIEDYDGELKTGLYFVKTDDLTILHQTNWYSNTILKYAQENFIDFEIIKQYIPSTQNDNKDYFKKMIDYVSEKCGMKLTKNIINSITGMLGKTKASSYNTSITTDINEVWECLTQNIDKIDDFFMKEEYYQEDKVLYIFGFKNKKNIYTNNLPMYIQILDQSNIKLHQLQKKLGGELVYRKTDAVVVLYGKNIVESDKSLRENWGKETIIPKEELELYSYGFCANRKRKVIDPFDEQNDTWNYNHELTSSSQYKDIIEYAIEKKGLLICSRAGTGKSYVVQQGVKDGLLDDDKRCRLAFTNKARRNINGTTIHSAISINGDTEKASINMVENYKGKKVIVVDEVSMISQKLWSYLILLKRISGATFILLGDYRQLPAVEDKEHNYFNSSIMKYLTNNNKIELLERQRYDEELWDWLEDFYEKGISGNNLKRISKIDLDYNAYNICYLNKTRETVNNMYMHFHKSDDALFLEHKKKDEDDRADSIYIYKDLPVMAIVNKLKQNKKSEKIQALFCNSDAMKVIDFNDELITMKLDIPDENGNDIVEVKPSEFHKSFVCNYCSTTHKNQGATISQNIQIWDWRRMQEDRRIGYTAVSRGKNVQQIKIVN
jgi:hypothetical protein